MLGVDLAERTCFLRDQGGSLMRNRVYGDGRNTTKNKKVYLFLLQQQKKISLLFYTIIYALIYSIINKQIIVVVFIFTHKQKKASIFGRCLVNYSSQLLYIVNSIGHLPVSDIYHLNTSSL